MRKSRAFVLLLLLGIVLNAHAQENAADTLAADTTVRKGRGAVAWIVNRLKNSNKQSDKPFDCSVIAGPFYDATSSFAIGGGISGIYSWAPDDAELKKSTLSAMVKAGVLGMLMLDINGKNFMPHDRYRWNYKLKISMEKMFLWGIGYNQGADGSRKGGYRQIKVHFKPDYLFRLASNLYLGRQAEVKYTHTYQFQKPENRGGQSGDVTATGLGVAFQYDSRDFPLNAYKGQYLRLEQMAYPKGMNRSQYLSSDITFTTYHGLWKKAVLAVEYHSLFTYKGDVPWTMMALVGDDNRRMRGYYEGRYRDRNIMECQVELRQRLPKRMGVVLFGGAANVFPRFSKMNLHHTLPNYGAGIRWEFKERVNIRLDCGFTKNKPGVVFNINEAF